MSTGYRWEGIRQVRATLLGARHVLERLCGGRVYLGRYIKCSTFTFTFLLAYNRLRGSASPVLTATHHSYGSPRLSDFFFHLGSGGQTPQRTFTQNGSNDGFSRKDVPFAVTVATFHTR